MCSNNYLTSSARPDLVRTNPSPRPPPLRGDEVRTLIPGHLVRDELAHHLIQRRGRGFEHRTPAVQHMGSNDWDPARGRGGRPWERLKPIVCPPGSYCWLCGKPIIYGLRRNHPLGPSVDHIISLANGGHPTALSNLAPAHFGCNSRKGKGTSRPPRPRTRDY